MIINVARAWEHKENEGQRRKPELGRLQENGFHSTGKCVLSFIIFFGNKH